MRTRVWYALSVCVCLGVAGLALVGSPAGDSGPDPAAVARNDSGRSTAASVGRVDRGAVTTLDRCAGFRARAEARAQVVTGAGERVVVLGDSWAVGKAVDAEQTWPTRLSGEIHVAAFPGSALSEQDVNGCGEVSFADRAPAALAGGADLVVVEAGINDVRRPREAITAGFWDLMDELRGYDVVFVAPPSTPRHAGGDLRVAALLGELTDQAGVPYIRTADIPITYLPDGLHPDAAGHDIFGTAVSDRIDALR